MRITKWIKRWFVKPPLLLDAVEQGFFAAWQNEINIVAANSTRANLAADPPKLVVIESKPSPNNHQASTSGKEIKISKDLLGASATLRKYIVAHELGHVEARHPTITSTFGWVLVACMLAAAFPWVKQTALAYYIYAAVGFAASIGIVIYGGTMFFEWSADKRAARMTSVPAIIQGINAIMKLRPAELKKYYNNKLDRLNGLNPPCWK